MTKATLDAFLNSHALDGDAARRQTAELVRQFATAAAKMRKVINEGALGSSFNTARGTANSDGDAQLDLDVFADDVFLAAARQASVKWYASEELPHPVALAPEGLIAVAIDPLDGSSNIDTNVSIGTIFSVLPAEADLDATFLQPGSRQIAAGFFIYGPQLALALTLGGGTHAFVFSSQLGCFVEVHSGLTIPRDTREFAINASNYRHWDESIKAYVDDLLQGSEGPREKDYNMRWIASLVADAWRILVRGGVFLYPRDGRKGYSGGRLRLVYEANPMALLMERAGGEASNGGTRILDIVPRDLHERTPLIFGSQREVRKIERYQNDPSAIGLRHPLFGHRGLFKA
ncbi:MAG: class 1 fructose-bisphosphatase [Nitratireductor sp.]|nr:class 1 fructose-bisphosphatase [Nitratireductor sp.]